LKKICIQNGRVIDPANGLDQLLNIHIENGKIASVDTAHSKNADITIDASGLLVCPGLIDIHSHHFYGTEHNHYLSNGFYAVPPDGFTFRSGVTTVLDPGGAGWKNLHIFKKNVINQSKTRVLALVNIVGEGMRGNPWEQDVNDMDPALASRAAEENKDCVVGFKVAHFLAEDWIAVDRVVEAGKLSNLPVMIDFGGDDSHPPLSIEKLFMDKLRPGDIYTHVYTDLKRRDPIIDPSSKKLKPFLHEARKKGIIFDVGHGGASFAYSQAIPAMEEGFYPDTISTDLHIDSMNAAMKDQLNVMSKFLAMKMPLYDVIKASTSDAAKAIRRNELGNLSVGSEADLAILNVREGEFGFFDTLGERMSGKIKLECEATIRSGEVVYDLNGISLKK
jgi:dihydroorotase